MQKAKKNNYDKIKNNPEYILKRKTPKFKAKLKARCNKYYNKVKDNYEFEQKVSAHKKRILYQKKVEPWLFEINL